MEQEAVQGMLSMASLHYPSALPTPAKSTDCNIRGGYPQLHIRVSQGNGKEHLDSHSHKAANSDHHVKDEGEFSALDWIRQPDASCRLSPQDSCQVPQSLRREFAHEEYEKAPEDKHYLEIEHWDSAEYQPEKYDPESSMSSGECHLSDGSLSPTRIYGDTAAAVPLHPTKRPASNPPPISNQATKGKRPKKGMATAKQRLGKILKLNRNGHARFFV